MKLFNLVKLIKTLCLNQPNVNTFFEGDIYDLNHKQDIDYSVMVLTHQTHDISVDAEYESFGCNLFYVDRLTSDGDNRLDVQSHAITVLEGIINELENQGFYIERVTINEFTERFDAECAGAYAQVRIRANSNCCCNDYKIVTSVNGMRGDVILDIETGTTVDQFARDLAEEALEKANQVENATFHTVLPNLTSANNKIEELERKTSDIIKIDDWGTNIDINGETSAAYNDTTLSGVSMMFADILEGGSYAPKGAISVNTDGVEIKGGNGKDVKVNTQSIGDPSKFLYNGNEVLTDKALKEYMEEQHLSFEDAEVVEWATWDVSVWKSGMYRVVKNNTRMPSDNLEGFGIVFHTKEGEGTDGNGHYFVHYYKKVFFEDAGPIGFEEPKVRIKSGSAYIYDDGMFHVGGTSGWHTIAVTDDIIKYTEGTGIKIDSVTNVISSTAPTQFKTINGETIVGTGDIVITGTTPDLKHYSEGTAYAQMKVENNEFALGDENLFIIRKYGDKESQISMKDEGIRLTTNGSVLINGKEAATLNDIKNQMDNLTVIEYPSFENGFYNYGWIRTVKRNQGVGFVGSDGVGLTLVTKEVMEGEDKVQTLKQYFIDNENNDIKVRTATLRTYADGSTWFEKGAWTKLNDTYTQGQGITIDPTTKTISSNIDIADYYTKEQSDGKYALKGDIPEPYDDGELRGRIESLEGSETAFTSDITALSGSVGTLSTQMENKADKSEIPSLDGYATEAWVEDKGYLTEHQQLKTINGQSLLGEGDIEVGGGASGNYLPLTGGVLTGKITVGNATNNSITNAYTHLRKVNNDWVGMAFSIGGDAGASIQHKVYTENFGSARNDAVLTFSYKDGLLFGVAASGNVGTNDYKKVLLEPDLDPLKARLTNIETQLNGLDEALETMINQF